MLPKKEQFKILESSDRIPLIKTALIKYLDGDWKRRDKLFTFTSEEFKTWCSKQDISAFAETSIGTQDTLYLIQEGNTWRLYWQERGGKQTEKVFDDFEEAKCHAIYACLEFDMGFKELDLR